MRYTTEQNVDYGDWSPEGERITGFVTERVDLGDIFGNAVQRLVLSQTNRTYGNPEVLMTVRAHWSGYSEWTITNQWSEVALTVVAWNWEQEWPSLGDFLRALADASPEADR